MNSLCRAGAVPSPRAGSQAALEVVVVCCRPRTRPSASHSARTGVRVDAVERVVVGGVEARRQQRCSPSPSRSRRWRSVGATLALSAVMSPCCTPQEINSRLPRARPSGARTRRRWWARRRRARSGGRSTGPSVRLSRPSDQWVRRNGGRIVAPVAFARHAAHERRARSHWCRVAHGDHRAAGPRVIDHRAMHHRRGPEAKVACGHRRRSGHPRQADAGDPGARRRAVERRRRRPPRPAGRPRGMPVSLVVVAHGQVSAGFRRPRSRAASLCRDRGSRVRCARAWPGPPARRARARHRWGARHARASAIARSIGCGRARYQGRAFGHITSSRCARRLRSAAAGCCWCRPRQATEAPAMGGTAG